MEKDSRTEKLSITIPRELAGEIRTLVPHGGISSFFTEALEYYLAVRKQKRALQMGAGLWKDSAYPGLRTPADTAAYVTSLRKNERSPALYVNEKKARKYEP